MREPVVGLVVGGCVVSCRVASCISLRFHVAARFLFLVLSLGPSCGGWDQKKGRLENITNWLVE